VVNHLQGVIRLENTATSKVFKDPQGRTLTVNSPDGSIPSEQELDQMFQAKYGADNASEQPKNPSMLETIGTNLARPGASVRERLRGLEETGNIQESNKRADMAWKDPSISETFDVEAGRKANESMDKSFVGNLPKGLQTVARYYGSIVPREVGFVKNTVLDPAQMAIGMATEGALRGVAKVPYKGVALGERASTLPWNKTLASVEGQGAKATDTAIKARNKAVKLYPNQDGNLEDMRNTAEQGAKYIQPAKNYEELANQMELAQKVSRAELKNVYDSGTLSNSRTQHDPLLKYISDLEKSSLGKTQSGKNTIKKLKDLHTSDVETLSSKSPEELNDPNFYQSQKEMFQKEANRLGAYDDPESGAMAEGLKKMSQGYQDKVYAVDEVVKPILNEQGGLIKSTDMAREMAKAEALDLKPSIGKEAVDSISGSPTQTAARFVRKTFVDRMFGSPAKGLTKNISKLMKKSEKAQALSDLISQMKNKPSEGRLEYPKELPAPPQKALPGPEDFRTRDIKAGRLLQGSKQGKTIKAEGRGPAIEMPEYLESTLSELAKKWGVPERNVREIINQADIKPVVKSSSTEGLIMSKSNRKEIESIMARRKRNFPNG